MIVVRDKHFMSLKTYHTWTEFYKRRTLAVLPMSQVSDVQQPSVPDLLHICETNRLARTLNLKGPMYQKCIIPAMSVFRLCRQCLECFSFSIEWLDDKLGTCTIYNGAIKTREIVQDKATLYGKWIISITVAVVVVVMSTHLAVSSMHSAS